MCLVLASPSECDYGHQKSGIKIFDLVLNIEVLLRLNVKFDRLAVSQSRSSSSNGTV